MWCIGCDVPPAHSFCSTLGSWADCLHTISHRHAQIAQTMMDALTSPSASAIPLTGVVSSRASLDSLVEGLRTNQASTRSTRQSPPTGGSLQQAVERHFRIGTVWPRVITDGGQPDFVCAVCCVVPDFAILVGRGDGCFQGVCVVLASAWPFTGPLRWTAQMFAFIPFSRQISFFLSLSLSLGGLLVELWSLCETPAASRPLQLAQYDPRESQNVQFGWAMALNHLEPRALCTHNIRRSGHQVACVQVWNTLHIEIATPPSASLADDQRVDAWRLFDVGSFQGGPPALSLLRFLSTVFPVFQAFKIFFSQESSYGEGSPKQDISFSIGSSFDEQCTSVQIICF